MREAITTEERITVTIQYLSTVNSYDDLIFRIGISPQPSSKISRETWVTYEALRKYYM